MQKRILEQLAFIYGKVIMPEKTLIIIDFVIQNKNRIIPIEVKSGKSVNNTSLTRYNDKFNNDISVRFSLNNFKLEGKILNVLLYFIEYIYKFI